MLKENHLSVYKYQNETKITMTESERIEDRTDLVERIRQAGHRATMQRLLIYDALWDAGSHPTVAEIHEHVVKEDPSIGMATVYKTLQLFSEMGLVSELGIREGATRYDPYTGFHAHLVCKECGNIFDFPCDEISEIISDVENQLGFKTENQRIELEGICKDCSQ